MRVPQFEAGGGREIGLTWFITGGEEACIIGHGGGTNGQITQFVVVPERGFALVVLTNANRGSEVCGAAVKTALQSYLGLSEPEATPLKSTVEELAQYVGVYDFRLTKLELTLQEGVLIAQATPKGGFPKPDLPPPPAPPPGRIALYAPDRAVALDPPSTGARIEFLRDPDGNITWLRVSGRVHRRQ